MRSAWSISASTASPLPVDRTVMAMSRDMATLIRALIGWTPRSRMRRKPLNRPIGRTQVTRCCHPRRHVQDVPKLAFGCLWSSAQHLPRRRRLAFSFTDPFRWDGMGRPQSADRFETVRDDQIAGGIRAHRLAEDEALRILAAELVELDRVRVGLGAFRHHVHAEIVRHPDDRAQDHRALTLVRRAHERLVDLDGVEREALEVGERGMAGAEIVERKAGAELADASEHLRGVLG